MAEDPVQVVVAGYAGFFEQDGGASQGIWCRALFTISKDDPKISRATWEMMVFQTDSGERFIKEMARI